MFRSAYERAIASQPSIDPALLAIERRVIRGIAMRVPENALDLIIAAVRDGSRNGQLRYNLCICSIIVHLTRHREPRSGVAIHRERRTLTLPSMDCHGDCVASQ